MVAFLDLCVMCLTGKKESAYFQGQGRQHEYYSRQYSFSTFQKIKNNNTLVESVELLSVKTHRGIRCFIFMVVSYLGWPS